MPQNHMQIIIMMITLVKNIRMLNVKTCTTNKDAKPEHNATLRLIMVVTFNREVKFFISSILFFFCLVHLILSDKE